ncbi:thiopeptide-type bacteriocin biosynthesis protein [Chryseobacterium flavum]|uniref:lantibiotic dehydratase n=1 Tax=Chryseobacterium flavum TaxID=415851 RepID=UPI002FD89698
MMMNNLFSKSILRTPVYSLEDYNTLLALDKKSLFNYLKKDDFFLYALYTSSPGLHTTFIAIDDFNEKLHNKLLLSCYKYYVRMCTRCIPFGLFSGVSIIRHEQNNKNSYITRNQILKTHTRLDSNYFNVLHKSIHRNINFNLKYYTNSSLYKLGNVYRYTEYIADNDSGKRKYILSQIESDKILNKIIKFCRKGAYLKEILDILVTEGYEETDSKDYIISLIESQILIDSFSTSTIGDTPEKSLLKEYEKNKDSEEFRFLNNITNLIYDIDNSDFKTSFTKTKELETLLLSNTPPKNDHLYFHKEVYFEPEEYDFENSKLIKNALDHLNFIGKKVNPANTRISKFIEVYRKRYGDTIRKLTDVLDIESGIGYGNFLNSGGVGDSNILSGLKNGSTTIPSIDLTEIDLFFINKIKNNQDSKEIIIQEKELQHFKEKSQNRDYEGATFSFMCNIYENEQNKRYIYLNNIGGNATKLVGRFTNGDKNIKALAQEISKHESDYYSDYICAELDYIPESSLGNVIHRDEFRDFKMSFLGGVNHDISIDDLLIQIEYNKVILLTPKGEKILPFFSNAFNTSHPKNLPLFELLVDIVNQFEATNANFFDIKHYHTFLNHIPRISVNNTILHRESWMISMENLKISKESIFSDDLAKEISNYLKGIKVPANFIIADGDNELVINLDSIIALEIFFNEIKKKKSVIIYEWLPNELKSIIRSPESKYSYNNEFLFLKKNNTKSAIISSTVNTKTNHIKSNMTPYSEWVYFKIDIGNKTVDNFLLNLQPVLKKLINNNIIKKFFYIKYVEESFQLRLRFLISDKLQYINLLNIITPFIQKYIDNRHVIKFSIDTYEREVLRYYGEKIVDFETIFFHDSMLSIEMIRTGKLNDRPVWIYCLEYIYLLLKQTLKDDETIYRFVEHMKGAFDKEFNANKFTTKSINLKYDHHLKDIHEIIIQNNHNLSLKNKQFDSIIKLVGKLKQENEDQIFIHLNNIIHMHIIRVVQNENRLYEYLIYSFIFKAIKTKKHILSKQI